MENKGLIEGFPTNLTKFDEPCPICIMDNTTGTSQDYIICVSKFAPAFMLQMYFDLFNAESICGFNSNFLALI